MERRPLGSTGLRVTPICLGCGVLGGMPEIFGYEVSADRGVATVRRALDGPINFLDTSAGYGDGESERRVGAALQAAGGLPAGYVLATKVDPDPITDDFSGAQVLRCAEESRSRLGIERFQLLYLHDPELIGFEAAMAPGGAVAALVELRRSGIAAHLGVAGGPIDLLTRFLRTGLFEVVLTHNRFTLVDRSAEPLLTEASDTGVAVVNAAPFGGGMLVKGPDVQHRYAYRPADRQLVGRVRVIQELCAKHDTPLGAAALRFSMRDPRVTSTVVGLSTPDRIDTTLDWAVRPIPEELWHELEGR